MCPWYRAIPVLSVTRVVAECPPDDANGADMERSSVTELLQTLVRMDTRDPPGREIDIARIVHDRLRKAGLESVLDEFTPGRANVVARLGGRGERPSLVFSAHFDTVPLGREEWAHDPFGAEVIDGALHGRGAADMKGGMAAMIVAAESLAAETAALAGDLVLAFTAGESSNCLGAVELSRSRALEGAGALLVSEPTSMEVLLAEKGALWLRLTAHGSSGHPSAGEGTRGSAIERMADVLCDLRSLTFHDCSHPLLGLPTVSAGRIEGGTVVNLTPDRCEVDIDVRTLPGMVSDVVEKHILDHVGHDLELERLDHKPAIETAGDHPFARLCLDVVSAERGAPAEPGGASYYSDATILAPAFDLPMVIIGPGRLGMSGRTDEYVMVSDVERAVELYRRIALAWLQA